MIFFWLYHNFTVNSLAYHFNRMYYMYETFMFMTIISSDWSTTSSQMTQSPANFNTNIIRHWRSVDAGRRPPNVKT